MITRRALFGLAAAAIAGRKLPAKTASVVTVGRLKFEAMNPTAMFVHRPYAMTMQVTTPTVDTRDLAWRFHRARIESEKRVEWVGFEESP